MSDTVKEELKPCPCCGGKSFCDKEPYPNYTVFSIWCEACGLSIDHSHADGDLIKAWNTRPTPTWKAISECLPEWKDGRPVLLFKGEVYSVRWVKESAVGPVWATPDGHTFSTPHTLCPPPSPPKAGDKTS